MVGDRALLSRVHNRDMQPRLLITLAAFMTTALATGWVVATDETLTLATGARIMFSVGLLLLTTIATVALTVDHSRWAMRVLSATTLVSATVAFVAIPSPAWYVAVTGVALSVVVAVSGLAEPLVRQLPPPAPLPTSALLLMLALVSTPIVVGALNGTRPAHLVLASGSVVLAWRYGQAGPVGLWSARLGIPLVGLWAALSSPPLEGVVIGVYVATLTALSWTRDTRLAAVPLVTHATLKPVFAELAPAEILAEAGYDEHGRRLENRDQQ